MKKYKGEETIKETYTDEELKILLQKPNMKKCTFATVKNLTSGKTCYFKVRTYKNTDSGKVYSSFSDVKSVTIK